MGSSITIHKYTLERVFGVEQQLDMPKGSLILACAVQRDQPRIWAAVDLGAPTETRTFIIIGSAGQDASAVAEHMICNWTGAEELELTATHIGTVLVDSDTLALHVFEKVAEDA